MRYVQVFKSQKLQIPPFLKFVFGNQRMYNNWDKGDPSNKTKYVYMLLYGII
jgi:hypothetical protein